VIVLERTATGKPLGEWGGPGGWTVTAMSIEIAEPKTLNEMPAWSARAVPILFDYDPASKEWVLVATFYTCTEWKELGHPEFGYAQYHLRDGQWVRVALDSKMIGRKANLLVGPSARGEPRLVNLAVKEKENRGLAPQYRTIGDHNFCYGIN
jgi:hypothetical protein